MVIGYSPSWWISLVLLSYSTDVHLWRFGISLQGISVKEHILFLFNLFLKFPSPSMLSMSLCMHLHVLKIHHL